MLPSRKTQFLAFTTLASLAALVNFSAAHSWILCTDYRAAPGTDAMRIWNPSLCFGLAKADYTPGQRVCLAIPSKHRGEVRCTNANSSDTNVFIFRSALDARADQGRLGYKGVQSCSNDCIDSDKSLCTVCFDLETDVAPGEYAFRGAWSANEETHSLNREVHARANTNAASVQSTEAHAPGQEPRDESPVMTPSPSPSPAYRANLLQLEDELDSYENDFGGDDEELDSEDAEDEDAPTDLSDDPDFDETVGDEEEDHECGALDGLVPGTQRKLRLAQQVRGTTALIDLPSTIDSMDCGVVAD